MAFDEKGNKGKLFCREDELVLGNAGEQLNISEFSLRLDVNGGEKWWGTFFPGNK